MQKNTIMSNMLPEQAWKLGISLIVFTGLEVAAVLFGFRGALFATHHSVMLIGPSLAIGWVVETWLLVLSGRGSELSDERSAKPIVNVVYYVVPPVFGGLGLLSPWTEVLSILLFIALLSRIAWILSHPVDRGKAN